MSFGLKKRLIIPFPRVMVPEAMKIDYETVEEPKIHEDRRKRIESKIENAYNKNSFSGICTEVFYRSFAGYRSTEEVLGSTMESTDFLNKSFSSESW